MKIRNKEQFKEAMKIIAMTILTIVAIVIIANYLRVNGFEGFFTTNLYKDAFEKNPNDIILINRLEASFIIGIVLMGYFELKSNNELYELKREEERLCKIYSNH